MRINVRFRIDQSDLLFSIQTTNMYKRASTWTEWMKKERKVI